ncbi:ferredoxin [Nesterenkonia cremea]|uniref:Ferredoxin n=1 Tax=Nesterenkonia cremea TaxID=1882340 RepID=A0A917AWG8_9MICC|nr:ferredoxin [Nesterenkonia cremea]GGE75760.1 ferredoxin [Nesterenkonia cremea]
MRIDVNMSKCQNHGQCAISAPGHFWFDEEGRLSYRSEFTRDFLDDVEDAMDACPMQAITVVDDE